MSDLHFSEAFLEDEEDEAEPEEDKSLWASLSVLILPPGPAYLSAVFAIIEI